MIIIMLINESFTQYIQVHIEWTDQKDYTYIH